MEQIRPVHFQTEGVRGRLEGLGHRCQQVTLKKTSSHEGRNFDSQVEAELELFVQSAQALKHLSIGCNDGQGGGPEQVISVLFSVRYNITLGIFTRLALATRSLLYIVI